MTLSQYDSLTEDEQALILYILNDKSDIWPKYEFVGKDLCWVRPEHLIGHIIKVEAEIKEESMPIYVSLLKKLGVEKQSQPKENANAT